MKKAFATIIVLVVCFLYVGCGSEEGVQQVQNNPNGEQTQNSDNSSGNGENMNDNTTPSEGTGVYEQITQEKAKEIMDGEEPAVILDVRTIEEFNEGHIAGAICVPVETLDNYGKTMVEQIVIRKDQIILVYCRSGNRSKTAAQKIADMGYTNVKEFGGIEEWQYGTVTQ